MIPETLAALYTERGLPCEIDAGPRTLIVYASCKVHAERIAEEIVMSARERDPHARVDRPARKDADEPEATSWWIGIAIDWSKF